MFIKSCLPSYYVVAGKSKEIYQLEEKARGLHLEKKRRAFSFLRPHEHGHLGPDNITFTDSLHPGLYAHTYVCV